MSNLLSVPGWFTYLILPNISLSFQRWPQTVPADHVAPLCLSDLFYSDCICHSNILHFFVHHGKQRPIQGFFPGTSSYITHFTGRHYFFLCIIPERIMCFSRLKRIRYADIISFIPHINIKRHIFLFFCFK